MSDNMSKNSWSAQCELASVQESNGKYKGFRPFCTTLELLANKERFAVYDNPQCFRHCACCAWNWLSVISFPAGSYGLSEGLAWCDRS